MLPDDSRLESIRRSLREKAAVEPSRHWLRDCWTSVQQQGLPNNDSALADEILFQLLHHDLRDVVRVFERSDNHRSMDTTAPSMLLRQAIAQSQQAPSYKSDLPATFRLLVQMEEFLDVSQNTTTRLEVGPANASSSAPSGSQTNRCLKVCFSDGYHPRTGNAFVGDEENRNHTTNNSNISLIAMEAMVIPQMSSNSLAGLKVLLTGPLTVRHGCLLLNPGNAAVLGGHVPHLVQMQQHALEKAKRTAGVGVDPTIRALIGNTALDRSEEEDDEGEHASRDVEPVPHTSIHPPPGAVVSTTASSHALVSPPSHIISLGNRNPPVVANSGRDRAQTVVTPMEVDLTVDEQDESSQQQPQNASRANNPYTNNSSNPSRPRSTTMGNNPYASQPSNPTTTSSSLSTANPYLVATNSSQRITPVSANNHQQGPLSSSLRDNPSTIPSQTTRNPYTGNNASNPYVAMSNSADGNRQSPVHSNRGFTTAAGTAIVSTTARSKQQQQQQAFSSIPPDNTRTTTSLVSAEGNSTAGVPGATATMKRDVAPAIPSGSSSDTPLVLPFEDLRALMVRIQANPALQEQYRERTFVASMRVVGNRLDFNIIKVKKPGKKKEKHYEYMLVYHFRGDGPENDDDATKVTCRVSNSMMEPYFELPAKEMRELSKADKVAANLKTKAGGNAMVREMATSKLYQLALCSEIPDSVDGKQPILILMRVHAQN